MVSNRFEFRLSANFLNKIELNESSFDYILNSIQYSIANPESMKCLTEEGNEKETLFSKCWCKILNELVYSQPTKNSPYITFFQSAVNSFHSLHMISTKTTICFSILLWRHLKPRVEQGNLLKIKTSRFLTEVLEQIIDLIKSNKSVYSTDLKKITNGQIKYDFIGNKEYFKTLLYGLCRNQAKVADLILDLLLRFQNRSFEYKDVSVMVSCSNVSGFGTAIQEFNYEIVQGNYYLFSVSYLKLMIFIFKGLVIKLSPENIRLARDLSSNKCVSALAIDASLVHDFTHLGFNKKLESTQYSSFDNQNKHNLSYIQSWYKTVRRILTESDVKLLMVREKVNVDILEFCRANSILVLSHLSHACFKEVIDLYKCEPLVYVEDFVESNIFKCRIEVMNTKFLSNNYMSLQSFEVKPTVSSLKLTVFIIF